MAYTPNSFGAPIGVTDQQIIDAFKSDNPNLQANMQEYMRTHGRTNADLLGMVKHYAPEAALDLNQIMSYTKIPNNQSGQMFSTEAPVTGGQLSQFAQSVGAAKASGLTQPAQGMTGSGAIPPASQPPTTSLPTYPHRPVTPNQQPGPNSPIAGYTGAPRPTGYTQQNMQPRPESFNPATSQFNSTLAGRNYQGGQPWGGVTGTLAANPTRSLPAQTKEEQLRAIFGRTGR